jgi:hypothetical protein
MRDSYRIGGADPRSADRPGRREAGASGAPQAAAALRPPVRPPAAWQRSGSNWTQGFATFDHAFKTYVAPPDDGSPPPDDGSPPPDDGGPGPGGGALTLDLTTNKQELRKKLKFFATASVAATLVAESKKVKETTTDLVANQETKVKAKLKRKARNRLEEKLDEKGKAKIKVTGTATTQSGAEATDQVKVKLKD